MTEVKFHLIRHAPVIGQDGIIYGDDAEADLVTTKDRIAELASILPSPEVACWYSSGVDRAHKTALAVLVQMGIAGIEPAPHKGFVEQGFGDLIGKRHEDITEHLNFVNGKIYAPHPPGGESLEALHQRLSHAFESVRADVLRAGKREAVIFSHGGAIRMARVVLEGLGIENLLEFDTPPLVCYAR